MDRILVVEDNQDMRESLVRLLSREYAVTAVGSLAQGREALGRAGFDLVLLDFELPDGDGLKLCVHMQENEALAGIPVIFLTSRSALEDKVMAFSLGAEDYIVKPCASLELRARIKARLGSVKKRAGSDEILVLGELSFNLPLQKVSVAGAPDALDLTPFEFRLLLHLAKQIDRVFSREQLLDSVWGNSVNVLDRTVDSHISGLRKKLAVTPYTIRAVHGVGYKLCKESRAKPQAA